MKIKLLLILLVCHLFVYSQSGSTNRMKNWELRQYAQESMILKDYPLALSFYSELSKRLPNNKNFKYNTAWLYLKTRNYDAALVYFSGLTDKKSKYLIPSLYYEAEIMKNNENYSDAEKILKKLQYTKTPKSQKIFNIYAKTSLNGIKLLYDTTLFTDFIVQHLNTSINTKQMEIAPVIISDTAFVYSTILQDSMVYMKFEDSLKINYDFYLAIKTRGQWIGKKTAPMPFVIRSNSNEAYGTFSTDGKYFFFTSAELNDRNQEVSQIYYCYKDFDKWSEPQKISYNINIPYFNSSQPTIGTTYSKNFEVLYFVSDRPNGYGGLDIYYSVHDLVHNTFTEPVNAGGFINSYGDELTPFYDNIHKTMYFSSNSYPSFGGYDIFETNGELSRWSKPQNIGKPINSSYDEFCFTKSVYSNFGLFISNRSESLQWSYENCCFDIYTFDNAKNQSTNLIGQLLAYNTSIVEQINNALNSTNEINLDTSKKPLANTVITLNVLDADSNYFELFTDTTDQNGVYSFDLPHNEHYKIEVKSDSVNFQPIYVNTLPPYTDSLKFSTTESDDFTNKNFILKNILFEFNSADLTQQSKQYLDSVVVPLLIFLNNIKIEIDAYTDNVGSFQYNLQLSQQRAKSVLDYLVVKGINSNRLFDVGFGSSKPLLPEKNSDGSDNVEARTINRRVEFKILGFINE